jgi:2-C-methyl-D-erythritol 4-phosphate cytidylyltransferase
MRICCQPGAEKIRMEECEGGKMKKNIGILLAAGIGERFCSSCPKQFCSLNGREVISYSIEMMKKVRNMDDFFVVVGPEEYRKRELEQKYGIKTIEGGNTRAYSFYNAMRYVREHAPDCEKILFHEAARPLLAPDVPERYFDLLDEYDYVETCEKIVASLGCYRKDVKPKREDYYLIIAPEAYRFETLCRYFDPSSEIYFAADQFPDTAKGYQCFDVKNNIKLTYR